jgi:carbamoyltransferase
MKGCRTDPLILGISASHNGAACLLRGTEILCAIQEERLSRVKRDRIDGARPSLAVEYCLRAAGITMAEIDLVVLCTQENMLDPQHDFLLNPQLQLVKHGIPWLRLSHHAGHAACALALSGEDRAAVLVVDGAGSPHDDLSAEEAAVVRTVPGSESISMYLGNQGRLQPLEKQSSAGQEWLTSREGGMPFFSSLGGMYSAAAVQIFGDSSEAGKVMGLAPLGRPSIDASCFFSARDAVFEFSDVVPQRFECDTRWPAQREAYVDLARSVQNALETALLALCSRLRALTDCDALCYAGGVALNGIANDRIAREAGFERVYIPAAAEDSGTAIGAAYFGLWHLVGYRPTTRLDHDRMGRSYGLAEVKAAIARTPLVAIHSSPQVERDVVERLLRCEIGGWFEGPSELGPRALGQRSIVADPRWADAKTELNMRIKRREDFRPFAPAILAERADDWFECGRNSQNPFMLRIWRFRHGQANRVPAVAHVDGSGRAQTVDVDQLPRFHALITEFEKQTGVPILLNTSFNGPGEPIVETPDDALWCMLENNLDFAVLDGCLVTPKGDAEHLLALVPKLLISDYRLPMVRDQDGWRQGKLYYEGMTPWGITHQRLAASTRSVIELIDGRRSGLEILEALNQHEGETWRAIDVLRMLGSLRRKWILEF